MAKKYAKVIHCTNEKLVTNTGTSICKKMDDL